jgi:hypothetical protein
MRELFREYSPAVPVVEAVGVGSGSGFVVQHRGRLLVVTNRHVIEGARDGVVLKFIQPARGGEKELVIGAGRTRVSAIHRAADLALVSLPPDAETELRRFGVVPVELAVSDHRPEEGEHVFAIGHPAGGDKVLTRTLSDGIVSGVGRKVDDASYLQVTVPINPGNSGGPLFDDRGCVVGVNTLTIRHSRSSQVALEALNFSLEVRAVHELLNLPARSLGEKEIAAVLRPTAEPTADVAAAVEGKLRKYAGMDYVPYTGRLASSSRLLRIPARSSDGVTLRFRIGATYAALLFTPDGRKVGAGIVGPDGKVVAAEPPDGAVELVYEPTSNGTHSIAVVNEADEDTAVFLVVLRK